MPRWAKYFMRIRLVFAVLIGTPIFLGTLLDIATHRDYMTGDKWVGLLVPPALVLWGTALPKLGRVLGRRDRQIICSTSRTRWLLASNPTQTWLDRSSTNFTGNVVRT